MSKRTSLQNRSLHLYLTRLAEALTDAGYDMKTFLEKVEYKMEVPWTMDNAKNVLWHPVQKGLTGKESTTDLDTFEVGMIYEVLNHKIAEQTGVSVPFPTEEELIARGHGKAYKVDGR